MGFFVRLKKRKDLYYIPIPKEYISSWDLEAGDYLEIEIEDIIHASERDVLRN